MYQIDGIEVAQIQLPNPLDGDPHPQLMFQGWGVHAGDTFLAWLPDGWHEITLEVRHDCEGAASWFIDDPHLSDICPVGLWCHAE